MRDDVGMDRTDSTLKWLIRLVILPGFASAAYLTYSKLTNTGVACIAGGDCGAVNNSEWSTVLGIPVTLLGVITYLIIFASTFVKDDRGKLLAAFFSVIGAAFSIFLQYEALIVLEKTCPYCLVSAVAMNLLAILTLWRMLRLPDLADGDEVADEPGDAVAAA